MTNSGNLIKDVEAVEKAPVTQNKAKERNFLSKKRNKKNELKDDKACESEQDFVEDVKQAARYGNIGHGVIVDKKV